MHHYFSINVMHVCVKRRGKVTAIVLLWCTAEKVLTGLKLVFCVSREMTHAGKEDHVSDSECN